MILLWRKRSGASWRGLLFALAAYAAYAVIRIPLEPVLDFIFDPALGGWFFWPAILPYWMLEWLVLFVFSSGIKWLTLHYLATDLRLWRDGVMLGLGSTIFIILHFLGEQILDQPQPFTWFYVFNAIWEWGIVFTTLNVGTSLAIMYSVKRKQARLLVTSIILEVAYPTANRVVLLYLTDVHLWNLNRTESLFLLAKLSTVLAIIPVLVLIYSLYLSESSMRETP